MPLPITSASKSEAALDRQEKLLSELSTVGARIEFCNEMVEEISRDEELHEAISSIIGHQLVELDELSEEVRQKINQVSDQDLDQADQILDEVEENLLKDLSVREAILREHILSTVNHFMTDVYAQAIQAHHNLIRRAQTKEEPPLAVQDIIHEAYNIRMRLDNIDAGRSDLTIPEQISEARRLTVLLEELSISVPDHPEE
jgi:FKBP-type peptidyl-prolyl cis-trans isomerase (trigger factor)